MVPDKLASLEEEARASVCSPYLQADGEFSGHECWSDIDIFNALHILW
jgi:hypothetical protein